jgi:hypothetical protein
MAADSKIYQFDMFVNEKVELEEKLKKEKEDSQKRQIRILFHITNEQQKRLNKLEEIVSSLVDYIVHDGDSP